MGGINLFKPAIREWREEETLLPRFSLCAFSSNFLLLHILNGLKGGGGQMSYKGKRSSMSGNMCILWRCTIFVQTYCVVWQKRNADILLSVQGKCNLPLRGRCTNPLEKTSWGLREEKRGQYGPKDNPPPHSPSRSPVNATTQVPLTSQEVDLCKQVSSRRYPVMLKQMVADCRLQRRRTYWI